MSAVGLTNTDLSIHDNLVQARWELDRADTGTKLAAWAGRWGRAACDELDDGTKQSEELEEAYEDASAAEKRADELNEQRNRALDALEKTDADGQSKAELGAAIDAVIGILSE